MNTSHENSLLFCCMTMIVDRHQLGLKTYIVMSVFVILPSGETTSLAYWINATLLFNSSRGLKLYTP